MARFAFSLASSARWIRFLCRIFVIITSESDCNCSNWENMPVDLIAVEIKEILEALGEITGDQVSDDIINEIFHKFCLGK